MSSSTTTTNLPPPAEKGVFSVTVTREINAPIDRVWQVLLDFPSYKEWNPFVHGMVIVNGAKEPLPDQTAAAGKYLLMETYIPPTDIGEQGKPKEARPSSSGLFQPSRKQMPFEVITAVDSEHLRVAWRNIDYPSWLLRAERWQALSSTASGGTKYETTEVFAGIAAYVVNWSLGDKLRAAFVSMADGLKRHCEVDS